MTSELQLLLEGMANRIESIDDRTRGIEAQLAERLGASKLRERLHLVGRWSVQVLISIGAGFVGHYLPRHG